MKIVRLRQRFNVSFGLICRLYPRLLASVFFFLFYFSATAYTQKEVKRILILFAAQSDLPAYSLVEKGIKSSLDANTEFRIDYFIEYMDRYRNSDQTYYQQLLDLYRHKYSSKKNRPGYSVRCPDIELGDRSR